MGRPIPIEPGRRFGRLVVIRDDRTENGKRYVLCRCDCGTEKPFQFDNLRTGKTTSCGCYSREASRARAAISRRSHGHTSAERNRRSRMYSVWTNMKRMCNSVKFPSYRFYGGRGIRVCPRWESFENFLADMGELPEGYSLDRKDRDQDFSPENCLYVPRQERYRNRVKS